MTEQQVSTAVLRLLSDNLTVSFYGDEKTFTRHDLHGYVVFNIELGNELAEINISHMEEADAELIKCELTAFWDKAAESFIRSNPDIKRFLNWGFGCE